MNTLEQDIATVKELIYQAKQRGETTDDLEDVLADYEAQLNPTTALSKGCNASMTLCGTFAKIDPNEARPATWSGFFFPT